MSFRHGCCQVSLRERNKEAVLRLTLSWDSAWWWELGGAVCWAVRAGKLEILGG